MWTEPPLHVTCGFIDFCPFLLRVNSFLGWRVPACLTLTYGSYSFPRPLLLLVQCHNIFSEMREQQLHMAIRLQVKHRLVQWYSLVWSLFIIISNDWFFFNSCWAMSWCFTDPSVTTPRYCSWVVMVSLEPIILYRKYTLYFFLGESLYIYLHWISSAILLAVTVS